MEERVRKLVEMSLKERPDLFLIDLNISPTNEIKIVIDGDNGVVVSDCVFVSRGVEHNLDREETDFSLEVTSAGATSPLTHSRQYKKNIGRSLEVKTEESDTIVGELLKADDDKITLSWKTREPKPVGKGKVTVTKEVVLEYDKIKQAKVKLKFN